MSERDQAPEPRIDVTLGDRTYTLRPTFGALERIVRALGVELGELQARFYERRFGVVDTTRILYEAIRGSEGNGAPTYEEIGAMVVREGIHRVAVPALEVINAALEGFERFAEARRAEGDAAAEEDTEPDPTGPQGSPGDGSSASPS